MKKSICVLLSLVLLFVMAGCGNIAAEGGQESVSEQETNMEQKTLVVYFSATGTTEPLAEYAAEILEADIYEIMPEVLIQRRIWLIIRMDGRIRSKTILLHVLQLPVR